MQSYVTASGKQVIYGLPYNPSPKKVYLEPLYWECYGCWYAHKTRCDCHDCPECGEHMGDVIDVSDSGQAYYDHDCKEEV